MCDPQYVGINRLKFLLESLVDLDQNLRKNFNSRLFFFKTSNVKELMT